MDHKTIKVAMICHFSNPEVREHLPLDKRRLYTIVRKVLRLPSKKGGYGDIAPWDTDIIKDFRNREDIELHVVSAHSGLKRPEVYFVSNKVQYHFISCDIAVMLKHIIKTPEQWVKFNPMIPQTRKIVDGIKPDIVLLVGAENAYISSTVLGLNGYPIYVLCQTVYNNPERSTFGEVDIHNSFVEQEIVKKTPYFGVFCDKHKILLQKLSNNLKIFRFDWPDDGSLLTPIQCEKKYDFVNFAMGMSNKKGFPDAIRAIAIVKQKYPKVTINLVGGGSLEDKEYLRSLVHKLNVDDNVIFTEYFPKQEDMLRHIQHSRFAVLPCKMDDISGTMMQAMQLCIPLVVYRTTGTPSLNTEKQCVLIAENSNIEDLAEKMIMLMDDNKLSESLKVNAREFQEKQSENSRYNGEKLIDDIKLIIDLYANRIKVSK